MPCFCVCTFSLSLSLSLSLSILSTLISFSRSFCPHPHTLTLPLSPFTPTHLLTYTLFLSFGQSILISHQTIVSELIKLLPSVDPCPALDISAPAKLDTLSTSLALFCLRWGLGEMPDAFRSLLYPSFLIDRILSRERVGVEALFSPAVLRSVLSLLFYDDESEAIKVSQ